MATVTLKGNACKTIGELPAVGTQFTNAELIGTNLAPVTIDSHKGKNIILNIFPSVDTGTCATSVRTFNSKAASLENTIILCVSRDLPFAHGRFCGAEGIENVESLSDFATGDFGKKYGVELLDGPLKGLHARSIVVINPTGEIVHTELVSEIVDEPNYDAAISAIK